MDILCGISFIGFIDKHINKQINNDTEKQGKENKTTPKKKKMLRVRIEPSRVNIHIKNPEAKTARLPYHVTQSRGNWNLFKVTTIHFSLDLYFLFLTSLLFSYN